MLDPETKPENDASMFVAITEPERLMSSIVNGEPEKLTGSLNNKRHDTYGESEGEESARSEDGEKRETETKRGEMLST